MDKIILVMLLISSRVLSVDLACGGGISPALNSFTATPITVNAGESTTLAWDLLGDVTSCIKSGDWSGVFTELDVTNGVHFAIVTNITEDKIYHLQCSNTNGITTPITINITSVNATPTISLVNNQTILEDNSSSVINFTITDVETDSSALTMTAFSSDTSIIANSDIQFSGNSGNRSVQFSPQADANTSFSGPITITLIVDDGFDTSQTSFDVDFTPVNDAPTFFLDTNIIWPTGESGLKQHINYLNNISLGPTQDENNVQNVMSIVTNSITGDSIFSENPIFTNSGSLAYLLNGASGEAMIGVVLQDDGGVSENGIDTSTQQTFTITVTN